MMTSTYSENTPRGTALVTGASSGIGAVYADRLAHRGYDLILVARNAGRMQALAERLRSETGVAIDILSADLSVKPELARVEKRLREDTGITLLLNNAGIGGNGPLATADLDWTETLIQVNILAATRLAAAAVPGFLGRRHGTIINMGSVLALAPEIRSGVYSGAKAYILNLTLSMHAELEAAGIRIQAVLPGATRTEIWERGGIPVSSLPPEMLMEVDEMVDAALAGLDQGELVTMPSLADPALWDNFTAARQALGPHLSRSRAAARYKTNRA